MSLSKPAKPSNIEVEQYLSPRGTLREKLMVHPYYFLINPSVDDTFDLNDSNVKPFVKLLREVLVPHSSQTNTLILCWLCHGLWYLSDCQFKKQPCFCGNDKIKTYLTISEYANPNGYVGEDPARLIQEYQALYRTVAGLLPAVPCSNLGSSHRLPY